MNEEMLEKETQELERLYGHNREENQQAFEDKKRKEKFYKWGGTFFKLGSIFMSIAMGIWAIAFIYGVLIQL
jgi:hypothetical protein